MASVAHSHEVHHDLGWHIDTRRAGLWLFIASESIIFLTLLYVRFFMEGVFRPEELNQVLGLIITSVLLVSSFTANRAEVQIANGDRAAFLRNMIVTMVLGLGFLITVVAVEWPEAMHFAPPSTSFGTVFFVITGMHAFHVLTGLIVLLIVFLYGRRGGYSSDDHWGVEASVKYWHFVDVVWVFVYPILYLVGP